MVKIWRFHFSKLLSEQFLNSNKGHYELAKYILLVEIFPAVFPGDFLLKIMKALFNLEFLWTSILEI